MKLMLMGCPQSLKVNEEKVGKRKEMNLSGLAFSEDPNHLYGNGREEVEIDHFSKNWLDALWTRLNHWINHLTATLQTWINPCKLSFPLNIPYSLSPTWYTAESSQQQQVKQHHSLNHCFFLKFVLHFLEFILCFSFTTFIWFVWSSFASCLYQFRRL